jgi:acyl carrier protein
MGSLRNEIDAVLIEEFEIAPELLVEGSSIRDTLELDSLDAVDLSVSLSERIDIEVDPSSFHDLRSLGDIYEMVEALMAKSKG